MSFISGIAGASASQSNADTQAAATTTAAGIQSTSADKATNMQWNMFMKNQENLKPWIESGKNALGRLNSEMAPGGILNTVPELPAYGMDQFHADPLYKVMMTHQADILAQNRAGAAGGGALGSGQQMSELQARAGTNAENYYQQGYNNNVTGWEAKLQAQDVEFNRLSAMAGTGQTAVTQLAGLGASTANNMSNITTSAGNNAAAAQLQLGNIYGQNAINQSNIMSNSLGNAFKGYQAYQAYNNSGNASNGIATSAQNQAGWTNDSTATNTAVNQDW